MCHGVLRTVVDGWASSWTGRWSSRRRSSPRSGRLSAGASRGGNGLSRTANAATARFCQGCGGALAPLRCIACNADLAAGAKFCGACGAPQQ
ncbi:zinc ribbon domain-containing protein [Pseudomonas aeruginosa]|uniref:zinc ribbon domain-containing protein n=1 Tax=Pseudomonas aeruginosa TaxID=287 RepID=UPI001F2CB83A|nr:zinc ribbon domain-containing protein [Pseudomonas aeruginosa]